MDREQEEMQFLGLFGIYKEAFKIMYSWWRLFGQISLVLILPLSVIVLVHIEVSEVLLSKIVHNEIVLDDTRAGSPTYNKVSDVFSSEWTTYWLFKVAYITILPILSLLYTSAVVYTIACIYTGREVDFKKVMSVVPKVWKRLIATFFYSGLFFVVYSIVAVVIFICILGFGSTKAFIVFGILYCVGLVYMTIVWQLASVVTVLEDAYGFRALIKSKALLQGKMGVAALVFLKLNISFLIIQGLFENLVVHGVSLGIVSRVGYGVLCSLLLSSLFLFGLVVLTVLYFVCKSYHHEHINKSALSVHLEVYLGEYVPLNARDVQLEHYHV
ncbi:uncharacterized protein LOC111986330 [Quercus suber]|uniref:uncharacterized protein LOC111986330 n=1 Tax=Quercus suber TaxID=58331 RepID=UPI000CE1ED3E|nr:uncharacterized protein LOC111986330 [Quercus suber]POE84236.1 hypothetical protein CFP56_71177 [Quercus suber]